MVRQIVYSRSAVNPTHSSGDTGVSAALVLHGTPPFHVYYRIQQDNQPPRNITKTFATSRGELTIQPERSGHYVFSFTHISDSYYRKVKLNGPSIDQIIHPPASADFAGGERSAPRSKRQMSSCEGGSVDVDVELRVNSFIRILSRYSSRS